MAIKAENAIPSKKPSQAQAQSCPRSAPDGRWSGAVPLSVAFSASVVLRPATILALQQSAGNRAVQREIARQGTIQHQPCRQCSEDQASVQRTLDPGVLQRKPKEGHDLTSPRFAGDARLKACFDDRARLTQGDRGPSVEKVQQALIDLGYDLGPSRADGIYGQKTWDAVKLFKANEELGWENIGDVGPGTVRRLDELFGSKEAESPPKVADEESGGACPSDEDIVKALEARPNQLNALVGGGDAAAQTASGDLAGQASAGTHVSIPDAVSRFKSKVNVTGVTGKNVSQAGQFFWVIHMHDAMRTELTLLSSEPTALAFVAKARQAREAIDDRDFAIAQRLIGQLDAIALTTKSPAKPKMLSLLRANPLGSSAIETLLWNALNNDPANSMPSLAPFLSLRTLMQLEAFDKQSCGFAAHKIADRLLKKAGAPAFFAKAEMGSVRFQQRKISWRLLPSAARVRPAPATAHNFPSVRCAPLACANDLTPCRDGLAF